MTQKTILNINEAVCIEGVKTHASVLEVEFSPRAVIQPPCRVIGPGDVSFNAGYPLERIAHNALFPLGLRGIREVKPCAAAARPKAPARRFDTIRAGFADLFYLPPQNALGASNDADAHRVSGQGIGHKTDLAIDSADSVAAMSDGCNCVNG